MKAIRIHSYGSADLLKLEEIPQPGAQPDRVLVKIRDAGVNPVDWKIRSGLLKDWMPASFPLTMGQDFSGEVVEAGANTNRFVKGDRVFGFAKGSYAEYASVPEGNIARIADSMDYETAAALPTPGSTAYQIVIKTAQASRGKKILIHGAAGGVGSIATELALWKEAVVIAAASGTDAPYLKKLGVGQVIDYKNDRFENLVRDVDVVIDLIGGETQTRSFGVLKAGGLLITTVGLVDGDMPEKNGVRAVEFEMERSASDLEQLVKLVDQGIVKPRLGQVVSIQEAKKAQELSETGRSHGKTVLKVA